MKEYTSRQFPDNFSNETLLETRSGKGQNNFYFDDDPLEHILYGADLNGPSPANLYAASYTHVQKIIKACEEKNLADLSSAISDLAEDHTNISIGMSHRIMATISNFFPYCPNPAKNLDITKLEILLVKIWKLALQTQDIYLIGKVGTPLFRWYEHHGQYEDARQILSKLIEISRQVKDRINEALYLNNFSFEYMLEKNWSAAIPCFETAAIIFKELNIVFEAANARANYWICKFELDDVDDVESVETEMNEIYKIFNGAKRWYERKPLILFAKIEEKRGNITKAIALVEKAIESAKDSNTTYPEIDRKYLEHLRTRTSFFKE